jgi:hypothetical protein
MTLTLNGYDVLVHIGKNPSTFSGIKCEVAAIAETLIKCELVSPEMTLARLKSLVSVLGEDATSLVLQLLSERQLQNLLTAVDPNVRQTPGPLVLWAERHLIDLAKGRKSPTRAARVKKDGDLNAKSTAAAKSSKTKKKVAKPLGTRSMSARRPA